MVSTSADCGADAHITWGSGLFACSLAMATAVACYGQVGSFQTSRSEDSAHVLPARRLVRILLVELLEALFQPLNDSGLNKKVCVV